MDSRVELGGKIWKNGSKTQILEKKFKGQLGTGNALFSYFDQCLYFDHNLLISDPI